jgi:thioredoxin 1
MSMLEVNDSNFDVEVLQSEVPVLVEFGATWCGPCKKQAPILEQVQAKYGAKVKVVTVDIDESPNSSSKYGIRSVPTLFIFNKSEKVHSTVGLTSLSNLVSAFEHLVK